MYHKTDKDFLEVAKKFKEVWKDKKSVIIAEPSIGLVDYKSHEAMCDFIADCKDYEQVSDYKFFKTSIGRLMVAYSREKFAEYAVDVGFDYILYIDDDHIYEKDIFRKLEKHIAEYDMTAPLFVHGQTPYYPVIYLSEYYYKCDDCDFKEKRNKPTENLLSECPKCHSKNILLFWDNQKYSEVNTIKKGDLITDADAIGFGCAIVKVDLFKRMPKPWFFSMSPIGEDILFCKNAKAYANAKIMVDTNVECPHLEERRPVDWRDYEREKNKRSNAVLSESKAETAGITDISS